jgi:tagatose 1,6-diphosphate aldolase
MRFVFLDPGPLIDGELQLIAPEARYIDEVLRASDHPLTRKNAPAEATLTRQKILEYLAAAPLGRNPGNTPVGLVPSYAFWLRLSEPIGDPPIEFIGGISLRIGSNREIDMYTGNIGYHVYPPARGHHYAERACRLVLPIARRHGMQQLWITCNPDNHASRRTLERLGAQLIETVTIPKDHPFQSRGETAKCRYLLTLS